MPGAPTPRMGIPLPSGGDDVLVPTHLREAAERIDLLGAIDDQGNYNDRPAATAARKGMYYAALNPRVLSRCNGTGWDVYQPIVPAVTVLPSAAASVDNQVVDWLVGNPTYGQDVVWQMRRSGAYWYFAGGAPRYTSDSDLFTYQAAWDGYRTMPGIDLPAAGKYSVRADFMVVTPGSAVAFALRRGTTTVAALGAASPANSFQSLSREVRIAVDAAEAVYPGFTRSGGAGSFECHFSSISVIPVRVPVS